MLKRKVTVPKSAPRSKRASTPKAPKVTAPPARRRFVISTKAAKPEAAKPTPPAPPAPAKPASKAAKAPANGQTPAPVPTVAMTSVDLTETIKTLLHLSQE